MNQSKVFLVLYSILSLVYGKLQEQICVPLGSVPSDNLKPETTVDCSKDGHHFISSDRTRFYACHDGIRYDFKCQDGLYFDPINKRCEWPKNLECNPLAGVCPNGSIPVIPSQPRDCSKRGYYVDRKDPSRFYQCWDAKRYDFKCHTGLYFDLKNKRCELASNMHCYHYYPSS